MERLTEREKIEIIHLNQQNISYREIGRRIGVNHTSISRFLKRYQTRGTINNKKPTGRKFKLNNAQERLVVRSVEHEGCRTVADIKENMINKHNITCSVSTYNNILKRRGLEFKKKTEKQFIDNRIRLKRLAFANSHLNWDQDQWDEIVFADETTIQLNRIIKNYGWFTPKQPLNELSTNERRRGGGRSLNCWACMTPHGVGGIVFIYGTLKGPTYKSILKEDLPLDLRHYAIDNYKLGHDNSPVHRSNIVQNYIAKKHIPTIDWPAYSPDMNPIENIWAILKQKVNSRMEEIVDQDTFERVVSQEWNSITPELCRRSYDSMHTRMEDVAQNNGLWTRF